MVQNEKKFCLSHSISQESYIIWFWFMVLICKMISPGLFFKFSKFWFSRLLGGGGKRVKNGLKWQKVCLWHLISQEPYIIWSSFVVQKCKMIISPIVFFYFFKILIFWIHRRVKGQKMEGQISGCFFHFFKILVLWVVRKVGE